MQGNSCYCGKKGEWSPGERIRCGTWSPVAPAGGRSHGTPPGTRLIEAPSGPNAALIRRNYAITGRTRHNSSYRTPRIGYLMS